MSCAASGATHAKIQTIFANNLHLDPNEQGLVQKDKIKSIKRPYKEEFERLKKLELSYDQMRDLLEFVKNIILNP